ncbi:Ig-like domain-containing protein [Streptomyces decoyicus]|nr:Ig-like domain-containing protein [Streptomyces decoyicus]
MVAATTTTVTSAPNPSDEQQQVTITATITPVPPATGTPTGTVSFSINGPGGGDFVVPVNSSGQAVLLISTLDNSTHNIHATYSGDASYTSSTGTASQTTRK